MKKFKVSMVIEVPETVTPENLSAALYDITIRDRYQTHQHSDIVDLNIEEA